MKKYYLVLTMVLCLLGGYAQADNLIPNMSNMTVSKQDKDALFDAVSKRDLKAVKALIVKARIKVALVNVQNEYGVTPLMEASAHGDLGIMDELVKNGALVNAASNQNWTALCLAANNKNWEAVKYLLNLKQNQHVSYTCGPDGREGSALFMAVFYGAGTDVLDAFIAKKANVNEFYKGQSLLMIAVEEENMDMVRLLVEAKADVNAYSKSPFNYHQTAAFVAVMKQNVKILDYLLKQGATLERAVIGQNKKGQAEWRTPMQVATTPEMKEYLISNGYAK